MGGAGWRRRTLLEAGLRDRRCRYCGRGFAVCSACERGQVYCSEGCRRWGRTLSLRAARSRHQRSEEGRLDHRDRNRALRARRARVTEQSSENSTWGAMVVVAPLGLWPVGAAAVQAGRDGDDACESRAMEGSRWDRMSFGSTAEGLAAAAVSVSAGCALRCAVCGRQVSRAPRKHRRRGRGPPGHRASRGGRLQRRRGA